MPSKFKWLTFVGGVGLVLAAFLFGSKLRPPDPVAGPELDRSDAEACHFVSNLGQPLVVDWEAYQRVNLEEAMLDGIVVVAYDCKSLRLLSGCTADGSYLFRPVSRKQEVVETRRQRRNYWQI